MTLVGAVWVHVRPRRSVCPPREKVRRRDPVAAFQAEADHRQGGSKGSRKFEGTTKVRGKHGGADPSAALFGGFGNAHHIRCSGQGPDSAGHVWRRLLCHKRSVKR